MKNILCIDDIATNLFTLESVLKSKKANLYNVLTAQSAHGGLDILLRKKVDLILLDVMMPDVDGFACAKMIRGNKKTKDIPIIFVTAKTDDATIERCYEVGGDDYVCKPFNSVELLARVSFHLRLKDKARLLSREKEYAQSVIDIQDNFIIVTDANQALNVNQSLLDFFGLNSLFEFQRKIHCVCQTFIKEEGYFYLELVEDSFDWVEYVINLLKTGDVLVKMKDKLHQEHTFAIKAKSFYDVYIVSLTDITIISEKSDEYKREANFDELTQIYNRNMLHRLMDKKIHNQKEESRAFVFMILDIDFFKKVNDNYGHLVGDEILKGVTALIKKHIRTGDIFARWGGEEFVLVLNVEMQKGVEIADSLRKYIDLEKFGVVKNLTCSFGVTEFKRGDTLESLTSRADKALYEAKSTGRNKVCQSK